MHRDSTKRTGHEQFGSQNEYENRAERRLRRAIDVKRCYNFGSAFGFWLVKSLSFSRLLVWPPFVSGSCRPAFRRWADKAKSLKCPSSCSVTDARQQLEVQLLHIA